MRAILCFCNNSIKPPYAHLGYGFDSLSAIEMITFGNDTIIDGNDVDVIDNSNGGNFVTSGKADIDGDCQANLDLINQNIENHQHLLDDEDWV